MIQRSRVNVTNFLIKGRGIVVTATINDAGFGSVNVTSGRAGMAAARRVEQVLQSFPSPDARGSDRSFTYFFGERPMPKGAIRRIDQAVTGR